MPASPKREKERLQRKRVLASQQVMQFEDEKSGHELNLARLNSVPTEMRDEGHAQAVEEAKRALAIIERAIETTEAERSKLPE